jgi:zinc protease
MPSPAPRRAARLASISTHVEHSPGNPLVDFAFMFRGGGSTDPAGKEGRLALTGQTMLRGTRRLGAERFEAEVDRLGAEIELEVESDNLQIHATVVARNAERLFALLAEAMLEPRFSALETARQRRAMVADIVDHRNDDDDLTARAFCRVLFANHPYGRPSYGRVRSLQQLERDDLVAAHRDYLGAANLLVGAAGPIDDEGFARLVSKYLGGLHVGRDAGSFPNTPVNVRGRTVLLIDKPERTRHALLIGGLGTHVRDADHTALLVANAVLGGMFSSRLSAELRVRRGWSYDVHSTMSRGRSRQSFAIAAMPSSSDLYGTLSLTTELLERWIDDGVTEREVSLAKKFLANSFAFEIDTAVKRLDHRLQAAAWGLPATYFSEYTKRIAAVTAREASEATRARISAKDLLYTVVATASEHRAGIERAIPDVRGVYVHPYEEDIPVGGLQAWRSTAASSR